MGCNCGRNKNIKSSLNRTKRRKQESLERKKIAKAIRERINKRKKKEESK